MSTRVTIQPDTAAVLQAAIITDSLLTLPPGQLARPLYAAVNKAIVALGGKWNRKLKGHLFPSHINIAEKLAAALGTGTAVNELKAAGFFETPAAFAGQLVTLANIGPDHVVLEPSAGRGAIATAISEAVPAEQIFTVELLADNARVLTGRFPNVLQGDFLNVGLHSEQFDRVVMNPPFERGQDIDHVMHAFALLKPGGRLVSVMANGVTFRDDAKRTAFREFVARHGRIEENAEGTFQASGTGVNTVTVILDKPSDPSIPTHTR